MKGSPLCFESASYRELSTDKGKLAGSAQLRSNSGILQHGTIMTCAPDPLLYRACGLAVPQISVVKIDEETFKRDVAEEASLALGLELIVASLTLKEWEKVKILEKEYASDAWNFRY